MNLELIFVGQNKCIATQNKLQRQHSDFNSLHTDPESNRLVQKVQKSKSLYRKIALITFVEDFLQHKKLIFFIA